MDGGEIRDNGGGAEVLGGGIYSEGTGASAELTGVLIRSNTANNGGGFYLASASLTLRSCTLSNNTATTLGPNGYAKRGATLNLIDTPEDGIVVEV